jgi:hypothetical protein
VCPAAFTLAEAFLRQSHRECGRDGDNGSPPVAPSRTAGWTAGRRLASLSGATGVVGSSNNTVPVFFVFVVRSVGRPHTDRDGRPDRHRYDVGWLYRQFVCTDGQRTGRNALRAAPFGLSFGIRVMRSVWCRAGILARSQRRFGWSMSRGAQRVTMGRYSLFISHNSSWLSYISRGLYSTYRVSHTLVAGGFAVAVAGFARLS